MLLLNGVTFGRESSPTCMTIRKLAGCGRLQTWKALGSRQSDTNVGAAQPKRLNDVHLVAPSCMRSSALLLVALVAASCTQTLHIGGYSVAEYPYPTGGLRAGAARVEITPPPGYPTGGHGPIGQVALGYWTRLQARAFFFEARGEESEPSGRIALATVDLYAVGEGLHDLVAKQVAELGISPDNLILAATHTHHGPSGFMTAKTYSQHGGFYPGFDAKLLEFLAQRIALAVRRAIDDARGGQPATLELRTFDIDTSRLMNRSPGNFLLNADAQQLMSHLNPGSTTHCAPKGREPQVDWDLEGCPRVRAVNREGRLLRIWRPNPSGVQEPQGTLVFFAAHPTVLIHDAPLNSPDFVGWAMRALELDPTGAAGDVVGFFNGAEGDIVARRQDRSLAETAGAAQWLRDVLASILKTRGAPMQDSAIKVSHKTSVAAEAKCEDWKLARFPMVGAAALGGAEGDSTSLQALGWKRGVRDRPRPDHGAHGVKLGGLDSQLFRELKFTQFLAPPDAFPRTMAFTWAQIGEFSLVAAPLELNSAVGLDIQRALDSNTDSKPVVMGLADGYSGYAVTPDEYVGQDYMAASTIWDQNQAGFVRCELAKLKDKAAAPQNRVKSATYEPGPKPEEPFGPVFVGVERNHLDDGLDEVLLNAKSSPARSLPRFEWDEQLQSPPAETECGVDGRKESHRNGDFCAFLWRRVVIDEWKNDRWQPRKTVGGWDDSDDGMNLVTLLAEAKAKSHQRRYGAIWVAPIIATESSELPPGTFYRFRVERPPANETEWKCSRAFKISRTSREPLRKVDCSRGPS